MKNVCKVDGCNDYCHGGGYCRRHYIQKRRHGKIFKRTRSDPNEIIIKDETAEIVLYNMESQEIARAIIDIEDVEKVKAFKWYLSKPYVKTTHKQQHIRLHHIIMDMKSNMKIRIDHKDRDTLNYRKKNLRFCSNKENCRNAGLNKNNKSGYKGVYWAKHIKKWIACIMVDYKGIHLGCYQDKKEAAKEYNRAAIKYFGEFACLNNI